MSQDLFNTILDADKSSVKVVQVIEDTITVSAPLITQDPNTYTDFKVTGYPNLAQTSDIIPSGTGTVTSTVLGSSPYTQSFPYRRATGDTVLSIYWDSANIYVSFNNYGQIDATSGDGSGIITVSYKVLICIP